MVRNTQKQGALFDFGSDDELRTVEHDNLMLRIDELLTENFINEKNKRPREVTDKELKETLFKCHHCGAGNEDGECGCLTCVERHLQKKPILPGISGLKKKWEVPIMSNLDEPYKATPRLVGVADMFVRYDLPELCFNGSSSKDHSRCEFYFGVQDVLLIIEAKPKILSVGELLRQVNTYKKFVKITVNYDKLLTVVASPDERAKKILEQNDTIFWKVDY